MDEITFRYLIAMTSSQGLDLRLMDVVTAYLYESLDNDIDMRVPERLNVTEARRSALKDKTCLKHENQSLKD
jgi:hypothetical protein